MGLLVERPKPEDLVENWIIKSCTGKKPYYRKELSNFVEWANLELGHVVETWDSVKYDPREKEKFIDELSTVVQDYYIHLKKVGYAPNTMDTKVSAVLSFFKYLKIDVDFEHQRYAFVKYHNRDLSKEDIKSILDNSTLRDRCFFLMMLESGLRPDTLTSIKYKHIKEDYEAGKVPMKIDLPSEILKDRVSARWTFIGEDGFKVLKEYLKNRELKDEDYLFIPSKPGTAKSDSYLGDKAFSSVFGRLATKLKMVEKTKERKPRQVRLYCLRKHFRNYMTCDPSYREYWMGHSIGVDEHYISRDPERHRQEYLKGYKSLRIYPESEDVTALAAKLVEKEKEIEDLKAQLQAVQLQTNTTQLLLKDFEPYIQVMKNKAVVEALGPTEKEKMIDEIVAESIKRITRERSGK